MPFAASILFDHCLLRLASAVLIDVIDCILGHEIDHHLVLDLHAALADGGVLTESFLQVKSRMISHCGLRGNSYL